MLDRFHGGLATELSLQVAGCLNIAIRAAGRLVGDESNANVADEILTAVKTVPWAQNLKIGPTGYPTREA